MKGAVVADGNAFSTATAVALRAREPAGTQRQGEPVRVGVPFRKGAVGELARWRLQDGDGCLVPVETCVRARWGDGSVRWLGATFLATVGANKTAEYELVASDEGASEDLERSERHRTNWKLTVGGARLFAIEPNKAIEGASALGLECKVVCTDAKGRVEEGVVEERPAKAGITNNAPAEAGTTNRAPTTDSVVLTEWEFFGRFGKRCGLRFMASVSLFHERGLARLELTVENPSRAKHAGGYWDLGDPGSVLLRGLALEVKIKGDGLAAQATEDNYGPKAQPTGGKERRHTECACYFLREWPDGPDREYTGSGVSIYQDSSGGEHWQCRNHVNRNGEVPLAFRGYRVKYDAGEHGGLRASPVLAIAGESAWVACAVPEFWEKFPTALEATGDRLRIHLLPEQFGDLHELQAGERCTRVVWLALGNERQVNSSPCESLAFVHAPLAATCDATVIAESRALFCLPSPDDAPRAELVEMCKAAIEGPTSLFAKREVIDEFGWRNYGDMWADHEAAYCDEPFPVISHYNNQYDLLHGLLVQYLLTADRRWWQLADPLARHVMDIDIYHTAHDKPAYNGGLFWHTAHYHDAATCTHRSMSRKMLGKSVPAPGGGPGNEHNYTSGLLLYHYLTGSPRAREAVTSLADWVLAMDDGNQHVLGLVSGRPTGNATSTCEPEYHGPGRGAGNSINALLDGWLLTGERRYLTKLEEIVRRTIHPSDEIEQRDLGNAELRWSYTVYLQSLAKFLYTTLGDQSLGPLHDYAQASLLHYARWMVEHESFYLDCPEQLEYPTETWAAQELRKGNVLYLAARWTDGPERELFTRRGGAIIERAWESLKSFSSRTCTRPLALVLQQGYLETCLRSELKKDFVFQAFRPVDFGGPTEFLSQKAFIRRLPKTPGAWFGAAARLARIWGWKAAFDRSWFRQKVRNAFSR